MFCRIILNMAPTLLQIAGSIQELPPSKWHLDINHFADILGITVAETNGFIKCIEKGGTGTKTDDKWKANPAPYNKQIDLSAMTGNSLNLHVTRKAKGEPNTIPVPSVVTLDKNTQFVWLGKNRVQNNNGITPKIQIEIVKYVIGTHQTLIQSYPDWAKFRQENWRKWIESTSTHQYHTIHLPWIAKHFRDIHRVKH